MLVRGVVGHRGGSILVVRQIGSRDINLARIYAPGYQAADSGPGAFLDGSPEIDILYEHNEGNMQLRTYTGRYTLQTR